MDYVFYKCVDFLYYLANLLSMSYEEINVWIFCIIGPIVFLGLLFLVFFQRREIKYLKS